MNWCCFVSVYFLARFEFRNSEEKRRFRSCDVIYERSVRKLNWKKKMATSEVSIKGNSVNGKGDNSSGGYTNDVRNGSGGGEPRNSSSSSSSARGNVVFLCETVRFVPCGVMITCFMVSDAEAALYRELWHACAGPLVTVPRERERVFYFPQGHIEQVGNS